MTHASNTSNEHRPPNNPLEIFATWRAGDVLWWGFWGSIVLGVPLMFLVRNPGLAGRILTWLWIGSTAASIVVRRHHLRTDFNIGWVKNGFLGLLLALTVWLKLQVAAPGDTYETSGERASAAASWLEYAADKHGTAPMPMYDAFTLTMRPGAKVRVRRTHSMVHSAGYVVEVNGDARLDVQPNADHVTVIGRGTNTAAVLGKGQYSVHGDLKTDQVTVEPVGESGIIGVTGNAHAVAPKRP